MRYTEIKSQAQLNKYEKDLVLLNTEIEESYNFLRDETREGKIMELQNYIDTLKKITLGVYNLIQYYNFTNIDDEKELIHIVREGDTLPLLSKAYYGNHKWWERIFYENELTTPILEVNQELIIPEITNDAEIVFGTIDILVADAINIKYGMERFD